MSNDIDELPEWVICPSCGCEAYWDGSVYFCDQCGWSGDMEDIELASTLQLNGKK